MPVMTAAPLKVARKQRSELERMARSTSLPWRDRAPAARELAA